jgi:hypothetical protein
LLSSLSKLVRGVSKISTGELDQQQVNEIVKDVFQRGGLSPPYSIEFRLKQSMASKPRIYYQGDKLCIVASYEPELKRIIGRFVIKQKRSAHEWLVMNHLGAYSFIVAIILATLPIIGFQLSVMISEIRLWLLLLTIISFSVFAVWTAYQVSVRSPRLLIRFTKEMADLGCMTEYDSKDYTLDYHKMAVGGTGICVWAGLVFGMYGSYYDPDAMLGFIVPLLLLLLAGLYFLFVGFWKSIDMNLCYENEYEDEEEWLEDFEINDYLQTKFKDLIDRLELQEILQSKHESEYETIRARFAETKYVQCRAVYDYVDERILYIDCLDISEEAAFHYGTALLLKSSLRFYQELSFKRRAVHLWALLLGLFAPIVGIVGAYTVSVEFGIGFLVLCSVVFLKLWYMGVKQYEEVRRELPIELRKTEVFNEYQLKFYNEFMFSSSSRSDWVFLIVIQLLFWGLAAMLFILA